jgi:molybdopterin molybdotransferase
LTREDGVLKVRTTGDQGSGILTSMVKANCLIDVPEEVERVNPGEHVAVHVLNEQIWTNEPPPVIAGTRPSCC